MSADPLATHTQSEMSPFDEWALRLMLDTFGRRDLRILEIGSWFGAGSTQVFAGYARQVVCVDHWRGNENEVHRALAGQVDPFALFRRNTEPFRDKVVAIHADSSAIPGLFAPATFDLVFIDGDHRYEQTRADIANALPLVRAGGILCGHDCEGRPTPANADALRASLALDHTASTFTNFREMHPGVIVAVDELLDDVQLFGEQRVELEVDGRTLKGCSSIWYKRLPPPSAWRRMLRGGSA